MKLAVITDEIDDDLDRALDVMLEYGVRGAELRQLWDKNIADAPRDYLDRAKAAVEKRGMTVVGIASPFYKCDLPGSETAGPAGPLHSATARGLAGQIDMLERMIGAAQFFDTTLIRVFSFWKRGPLTPGIEETIVDAFAEPAALAESAGVTLGLENEHACFVATGGQAGRIVREIGSPAVRVIWDPGNAFFAGERPYPIGYEAVRGLIAHVHVKDAGVAAGAAEPAWTVVGEGEIDYKGQLAALRADGYDGYLSLETHYRGGATKEASSRSCLEGLLALLGAPA
jgi:sugar phosphate isomerase/epimerase